MPRITRVNPRHRTWLRELALEGKTVHEVAAKYGVPERTVRSARESKHGSAYFYAIQEQADMVAIQRALLAPASVAKTHKRKS